MCYSVKCAIFSPQMHPNAFGCWTLPGPAECAYNAPGPPNWIGEGPPGRREKAKEGG